MTCKDCIHDDVCPTWNEHTDDFAERNADTCKHFKNKVDFVEVVRCEKCKYGDVSIISRTKDGQEDIACYCELNKVVTNVDSYCPSGRKRDT